MNKKTNRFYYGWVIVAVSFLTLFLTLGARFSFGLFYAAILKEYGWGRAEAAGAFSLMMIMHSLMAPMTGILIDRFGPRILFPLAAIILGVGLASCSLISELWHFYLYVGVITAIGSNMTSYAPHISRVPHWFYRKKGLASGLISAGMGVGTLGLALLVGFIIDNWGWRQAFLYLGGLIFFLVAPMNAIYQRRSPADVGQSLERVEPLPQTPANPRVSSQEDPALVKWDQKSWTFKAAFKTLPFWSLNAVGFFQGFFINTMVVHLAVFIFDKGFSSMLAAWSLGVVGLLSSIGGIIFGVISDRVGREIGFSFGSLMAVLGIVLLLFVQSPDSLPLVYAFVLFYGIGYGANVSIIAASTGDLFSGNAMGKIISMQAVTFGIGSALGAYLGGFFYDRTGGYHITFLLVLTAIILTTLFLWIAAPRKRGRM